MKSVHTGISKVIPFVGVEDLCTSKKNKHARKDRSCKICLRCMRMVLLLSLFTFVLTSAVELFWIRSNDRTSASFRKSGDGGLNPLGLSNDIRVYLYELPAYFNQDWLANTRCSSHLFAAEVALHRILIKSSVRTHNPEDADFFFVPVYVSCNFSTRNGFPSLQHARTLLQSAVELISKDTPHWNRSNGRDHVFVATHDFGACFHAMEDVALAAGIPKFLENSIILQTFAKEYENPCQKVDFIQIPPYVPPKRSAMEDLGKRTRDIWVFFGGKMEIHPKNISGRIYSRAVRTALWQKFSREKRFYIKRKRSEDYQYEMLRSTFCLCPLGWAPWSPRIVESVIYGCVPVIIADSIALPFSNAITWNNISLTVPEREVENLDTILSEVSKTNLTTIQGYLWKEQNRKALLYTDPLVYGDATWQILDQLALKKKNFAPAIFQGTQLEPNKMI